MVWDVILEALEEHGILRQNYVDVLRLDKDYQAVVVVIVVKARVQTMESAVVHLVQVANIKTKMPLPLGDV